MDLMTAIKERRSVRRFKDQKVERALLNEVLEATNHTPTWGHFQEVRYHVIDNKDIINKIASEGMMGFNHNMNIVSGAPGLLVISLKQGKTGVFPEGKKKAEEWEMFDAGCAAQTFSLAAYSKGIGSVILGIFDEPYIHDILDLGSDEVVATLLPFGYEVNHPKKPPRKSLEEVVSYV